MDLRRAADTLGVHYQTAYGWVRQGLLPARKIGRGYQIRDEDVAAFAARRRLGQQPVRPIHVRDWTAQAGRLYAALADGEETLARQRLERLAGGVTITDLCDHLIAPDLRPCPAARRPTPWSRGRHHPARRAARPARAHGRSLPARGTLAGASPGSR